MTFLPKSSEVIEKYLQTSLIEPINEYLSRPKKEIRTQLVKLGYQWAKGDSSLPIPETVNLISDILEVLHAGSLIVDDIQDESRDRRGQPSFHLLHGIPTAINSGSWLYFLSIQKAKALPLTDSQRHLIIDTILDTLFEGHIGQAIDIGTAISKIPRSEIPEICYSAMTFKTGALTGLAMYCGAIAANATPEQAKEIALVGREFGLLLQIYDDLKNLKSCSKKYEDLYNLRPGFIWAFTVEALPEQALKELSDSITNLPDTTEFLSWCTRYNVIEKIKTDLEARKKEFISKQKNIATELNELLKQLELAYEKS